MRLLCDEMLLRLCRWLRAAGYDTALAAHKDADAALIARCADEGRTLITRDRDLAALAGRTVPTFCLVEQRLETQARALRLRLGIDWQHAPFTRCLVDNSPLQPAPPEAKGRVPEQSREAGGPLWVCPACGRLYWPGGHVRRMQARLAAWNRA